MMLRTNRPKAEKLLCSAPSSPQASKSQKGMKAGMTSIALMSLVTINSALGASIAFPDLEIQKSEKRCKGEYLDRREPNQRLYDYCVRRDRKAFADLEAAMSNGGYKDVPDQLMADIVAHSKREWLDRPEYDYGMFKFELNKQAEGYLDAQWELKNGNNTRSQYESCSRKWIEKSELKADWSMVHYCMERAGG